MTQSADLSVPSLKLVYVISMQHLKQFILLWDWCIPAVLSLSPYYTFILILSYLASQSWACHYSPTFNFLETKIITEYPFLIAPAWGYHPPESFVSNIVDFKTSCLRDDQKHPCSQRFSERLYFALHRPLLCPLLYGYSYSLSFSFLTLTSPPPN